MTSWIKQGWVKGLTGEPEPARESATGREECVREQGVGAAASDSGGISGWWLHEWILAVTAADGWRNPSGQHVFSYLGELNTDRRLHLTYTYTHLEHWALLLKKSKLKTDLNCKNILQTAQVLLFSFFFLWISYSCKINSLQTNWISWAPTLICTKCLRPRVHRQGASLP